MLALRALRLIRLLRILKLNRYFDAVRSIGAVLAMKKRELIGSLFFVLLLMLVSSLLMYSAEHEAQPDVFRNAFSGLWWAVATLTTVGYGDIYPITVMGRILGAFIAISGIAALAIPTGIITAGLTEQLGRETNVERELHRQRQVDTEHDDELARQRGKDDDHDRLLREQGEMLKVISEKLSALELAERKRSEP
jgi:voltage-gated potassium channel